MGSTFSRDPKQVQVKQVGYQLGGSAGGRDSFETPKVDLTVVANAIEKDSYIAQAVMRYKELIFKSGWQLKSKNDQSLLYLKTRLEIIAIATGIPTEDLFQGIGDDIVRYSNCFLVKARAKGGKGLPSGMTLTPIPPNKDPIAGYFRLPPQTIEISRDQNGNIMKYKQTSSTGGGDSLEFDPKDIIHLTVNRPVGESFGIPWLGAVIEDVRLLRKVEENIAIFLYRHAFPLLTYTVGIAEPGYESTDEEIANLKTIMEAVPTDGAFILPERHKIDSVKLNPIDAKPYLEYYENRVFTGLGMSAVDMGRGDTANRSTADAMTGMKADRVKGWQQQIQVQVDKFIIDELLVEGGFDPLINSDFDVNFMFNEIEQEMRIKTETHEIFKFEHNIQTFDETRKELGLDPNVDESRLHANLFGSLASSAQTDNMQRPTNQSGTRSGPKRATESLLEQRNEWQNSAKNRFLDAYNQLSVEWIAQLEDARLPLDFYLSIFEKAIERLLQSELDQWFLRGKEKAILQFNRSPKTKIHTQVMQWLIDDSLQLIRSHLKKIKQLTQSSNEQLSIEEQKRKIAYAFESLRYQYQGIVKSMLFKSFNAGFLFAAIAFGESSIQFDVMGTCQKCNAKRNELLSLEEMHALNELHLYKQIPPFHPNCECELKGPVVGQGGDFA